jgi:hypothetical protein
MDKSFTFSNASALSLQSCFVGRKPEDRKLCKVNENLTLHSEMYIQPLYMYYCQFTDEQIKMALDHYNHGSEQ